MKKCPYCAEEIQDEAILCRFCNSKLTDVVNSKHKSKIKCPHCGGDIKVTAIVCVHCNQYVDERKKLPIKPPLQPSTKSFLTRLGLKVLVPVILFLGALFLFVVLPLIVSFFNIILNSPALD